MYNLLFQTKRQGGVATQQLEQLLEYVRSIGQESARTGLLALLSNYMQVREVQEWHQYEEEQSVLSLSQIPECSL